MAEPLLATKLFIPRPPLNLVPRPHLVEKLDAGLDRKLTLISAPAGFGKTTLLSTWIQRLQAPGKMSEVAHTLPVAWLSLDEGDNDLARFLAYLVTALQTIWPGLGEGVLRALQSPQSPPTDTALVVLINEIVAMPIGGVIRPPPHVLVLDDYHAITAQPVHDILAFLVDHLPFPPQGLHLVLATRADPRLPLARWRSRGQMAEVRAHDLRFRRDEAGAFLSQVMGLRLSTEEIDRLEARTEGWIAGLQLAALSLQGRQEVSSFIQTFAGDDRYVIDYLVEEVLQRQPAAVQGFLLQTAVLDRLCGSLSDAITAQAGSQVILERLERGNLFIVPLDGRRLWYRYHHLFRDVLRHRMRQALPDRVEELHRRAACWYEEHGFAADAVGHALAGGEFETAARLIERTAWTLLSRGEMTTLLGWLDKLPDEFEIARPQLGLIRAWALVAAMELDAAQALLARLERAIDAVPTSVHPRLVPGEAQTQGIKGELAAVRATLASMWGDASAAIEFSRDALARLPRETVLLRGVIANSLGAAHDSLGDAHQATRAFAEAAQYSQTAGNTLIALIALGNLARLQETQGRLHEAEETCRQALQFAAEQGPGPQPAVGTAHVELGRLLCEWNDLESASYHLRQGIELGKQSGIAELVAAGHVSLARVYQARGDIGGALQVTNEARHLVQQYSVSVGLVAQVAACQARLWVLQESWEAADRWARESGLDVDDPASYVRHGEYVALARLLIARQNPDDAATLLGRLLQAAQTQGRMGQAVELLVLQALALRLQDKVPNAVAALARALSLGEPEGYVRTFVDEGAPMALLLRRAVARGIAPNYAASLLAALDQEMQGAARSRVALGEPCQPTLVEPLSGRERQVLHLLAVGLTNREIAEELVVTVGTVKWHVHNIYGKLGVRSRTQAIARARESSLLS
jgi:LuxR family maltose regulon positive regulatory protein